MHRKNETGLYEVVIDSKKYEFEKWGAEASLATLVRIAKIAGKPIGFFLGAAMGEDGLKTEIKPDLIASACESLLGNMDESVCIGLIKKLSSENVLCDGKKIDFNTHYEDNLLHLFSVVKAALGVQYKNFFDAILKLFQSEAKVQTIMNHKAI